MAKIKTLGVIDVAIPGCATPCAIMLYPAEDNKRYQNYLTVFTYVGNGQMSRPLDKIPLSDIISIDYKKPFMFGDVQLSIKTKSKRKQYYNMAARRSMFDANSIDKLIDIIDELNED